MPYYRVDFSSNPIENGVTLRDSLYYADIINGVLSTPNYAGQIVAMNSVAAIGDGIGGLSYAPYIFFAKPKQINESSVKGYYADLTMRNDSMEKASLYCVSSQITPSSK